MSRFKSMIRYCKEEIIDIRGVVQEMPIWFRVYSGTILVFWIFYFYVYFYYGDPNVSLVILDLIGHVWSPTGQPLLDFLIDTVIVIVGIAIAFGAVVSLMGLAICYPLGIFAVGFLALLASRSLAGALLAVAIIIAVFIYYVARDYSESRKKWSHGSPGD